jgi:hypothetical protein
MKATKESSMSRSLSVPRLAVSALVAAALLAALVPALAGAATPRAGYFSGPTSQVNVADPGDEAEAGSVGFKVFKYGSFNGTVRKVLSVSAKTQLTCASGEVKQDRYLVYIIMGGQINKYGKFKYAGSGFTIRGRFTSRTSATGTLTRTVGDCKAEGISWTAKRSTGGLPIPS